MTTNPITEAPSAARVLATGAGVSAPEGVSDTTALATTIADPGVKREAAQAAMVIVDRQIALLQGGLWERLAQNVERKIRECEFYLELKPLLAEIRAADNRVRELLAAGDRIHANNEARKASAETEAATAAAGERKKILQETREEQKSIIDGGRVLLAEINHTLAERREELKLLEATIHRTRTERDRLINSLRAGAAE